MPTSRLSRLISRKADVGKRDGLLKPVVGLEGYSSRSSGDRFEDFSLLKRLGESLVGSKVASNGQEFLCVTRYDNNFDIGQVLPKIQECFHTILIRHENVCDDEIRGRFVVDGGAFGSIRRFENFMTRSGQIFSKSESDGLVVFHYENKTQDPRDTTSRDMNARAGRARLHRCSDTAT